MADDKKEISLQTPSRATKPDKSREKSLYFLLLAVGRRRAVNFKKYRSEYRTALNSLEIVKRDAMWIIAVDVHGDEIAYEIKRNEFQFYQTGLNSNVDEVVYRNLAAADTFWKHIEAKISMKDTGPKEIKSLSKEFRSRFPSRTILWSLYLPCIVAFPPTLRSSGLFFAVTAPVWQMFWNSSKRTVFIILYPILFIMYVKIPLHPVSLVEVNSEVIFTIATFCFIWMQLVAIKNSAGFRKCPKKLIFLGILTIFNIKLNISQENNRAFLLAIISTIIVSILLPNLRRKHITNTQIVLSTILTEVLFGISLGVLLITHYGLNQTTQGIWSRIFGISVALLWLFFLFIDDRQSMIIRIFYPFLIISVLAVGAGGVQGQINETILASALMILYLLFARSSRWENSSV